MKRTKSGHTRKGKATITAARLSLRSQIWVRARFRIRVFLKSRPGEQSRMARALGISDSQIHRYTCPKCEHDQEPTFTVGMAMLFYIAATQNTYAT